MSEPISDDRLAELVGTHGIQYAPVRAALLELQERRKAEGEQRKQFRIHPEGDNVFATEQEAADYKKHNQRPGDIQWRFAAGEWQDLNR